MDYFYSRITRMHGRVYSFERNLPERAHFNKQLAAAGKQLV